MKKGSKMQLMKHKQTKLYNLQTNIAGTFMIHCKTGKCLHGQSCVLQSIIRSQGHTDISPAPASAVSEETFIWFYEAPH